MKIDPFSGVKLPATRETKKKPRVGGTSDFASALEETNSASEAKASAAVNSPFSLQAAAFLNSVDIDKASIQHGRDLLDALYLLQHNIIDGYIEEQTLQSLVIQVQQKRVSCRNPEVEEVLLQIEQRVNVELAKWKQ